MYPTCFPIAECNPLGPFRFRFDPEELVPLRNDGQNVDTNGTISMARFMGPEFQHTGGVIQFISLFYFL